MLGSLMYCTWYTGAELLFIWGNAHDVRLFNYEMFKIDWSWNLYYSRSPPSTDSKVVCCQLHAKLYAQSTG